MPILNIKNAKFYYELHGEGEPLVLIGGLKADHTAWLPVLESLEKQYKVLIFDNRGAGRTVDSGEPFSVETMADDVIQLVKSLELNKPHIVGHSLGGAVAQVIANKYPDYVSSVALCNTFEKFNDIAKNVFSHTLKLHRAGESQANIMDSIVSWVFSPAFLNSEIIEIIRKSSNENPYPQSLSGYERQLQALCDFDSRSWIQSINVPVLVIGSEDDKVATLAESHELAKNISGSTFVNIPTGHASQVEKPEMFIEALSNFYNELARPLMYKRGI